MNFQYNIYEGAHNELIFFIKFFENYVVFFGER